jgi:hypothetical protein
LLVFLIKRRSKFAFLPSGLLAFLLVASCGSSPTENVSDKDCRIIRSALNAAISSYASDPNLKIFPEETVSSLDIAVSQNQVELSAATALSEKEFDNEELKTLLLSQDERPFLGNLQKVYDEACE